MSDVKHTPGPWSVVHEDDGWGPMVQTADGKLVVADCESIGSDMPDEDECIANARLIAACPAVGDAAVLLVDRIRAEGGHGSAVHGLAENLHAALRAAGRLP